MPGSPNFLCRQYVAQGRLVVLFDGKFAHVVPTYAIYPRSCPSTTQAFIHFMRYNKLFGLPLSPQNNGI
ncbi:hypothetical protein L4D76_20510 [Photobacterium sagamiensis]|uniref:hypothetical protein n=1 Tax=Photobacterium sagamiensis TaxID=2910241 RepID=UPI003D13AA94